MNEGARSPGGPLASLVVVEMAGLGPAPLACLILREMGARVIRIERPDNARAFLSASPELDLDRHGREILTVDLKKPAGRDLVIAIAARADLLVEGYRPGVMERLGLGPEDLAAANPRLIYGRMTGFGQNGPLAARAGHDLTYLALTGALAAIGSEDKPIPPLNLVADYGGGSMFLVAGLLAALVERSLSGRGQVVDAAMVDGASMLAAPFFSFIKSGFWTTGRASNLLDGGAPFYDVYRAASGGHVAIACLEPQFFAEFCRLLPLGEPYASRQYDRSLWPAMREAVAARIAAAPRDHWAALFEGTDACVAPVLTFDEASQHPHARARQAHTTADAFTRPSPAPRFSATPGRIASPPRLGTEAERETLLSFGFSPDAIDMLAGQKIIGN